MLHETQTMTQVQTQPQDIYSTHFDGSMWRWVRYDGVTRRVSNERFFSFLEAFETASNLADMRGGRLDEYDVKFADALYVDEAQSERLDWRT